MAQLVPPTYAASATREVRGTASENSVHYAGLDGFRTVAFAMVFLAHFYAVPWGFGGVNFFFVLSGFLITGILWDSRDRPDRARTFYVRRTLRIFPLYYGALLLFWLSTPWFRWQWSLPWLAWPAYMGNFLRLWGHHTQDPLRFSQAFAVLHSTRFPRDPIYFGHFWSLCVEEQFYLVWPWIVFAVRSRKLLLRICFSAVIVCPLVRVAIQHVAPVWVTDREILYTLGVPFQLDSLLLGALLALLWRGSHRDQILRAAKVLLPCLLALLAMYVLWALHRFHLPIRDTYRYPAGRLTWGLSVLNLYGAVLMLRALDPGSGVYRVLRWNPIRYIGRITYGAYVYHELIHGPLVHLTLRAAPHVRWIGNHVQDCVALLGAVMTLAIAALSFRFLESPWLRLKERWAPTRVAVP